MLAQLAFFLALAVAGAQESDLQSVTVNAQGTASTGDTMSLLQTPSETMKMSALQSDNKQQAASSIDMKAAYAEMLAMILFVIIGCGSAMALANEAGWFVQVSLAFGLAITTLAYTIGHYSGGQINYAVTFGLCIQGSLSWQQGFVNLAFQLIGSVIGALILNAIFGEERDKTGGLGTNSVSIPAGKEANAGRVIMGALIGEFAMTFLLMYVVLETAKNPANAASMGANAPIAIGFAVFLAHCMLIPVDGCSINPTRSFGPAVVRMAFYENKGSLKDMWVFWVGPLAGAAVAAGIYKAMST